MLQQRDRYTWAFLSVLACAFIVTTSSPRLWDDGSLPQRSPQAPLASISHHGGADIPVCLGERGETGRQECLPHQSPSSGLAPRDENRVLTLSDPVQAVESVNLVDSTPASPATADEPAGEVVATDEAPAVGQLGSLLKKGTGSEPSSENAATNNGGEAPVPLLQQAAMPEPAEALAETPVEVRVDAKLVEPSEAIAAETPDVSPQPVADMATSETPADDAPGKDSDLMQPEEAIAPLPDSIRRLPAAIASIPSPLRTPRDQIDAAQERVYPETSPADRPTETPRATQPPVEQKQPAKNAWREPDALLDGLKELAASGTTKQWATDVLLRVHALGAAIAVGSAETSKLLDELEALNVQAPELAKKCPDQAASRRLLKTNFALGRRLDVWREVVELSDSQPAEKTLPEVDPRKLAECLATIDAMTGDSPEGAAWRKYLLVDALKESASREQSPEDRQARQAAQQALARLTQTPLTSHQQKFVASGPVAALRAELRRWAAEPIGVTTVLRDIERYERTGLPSDARRLALDCQHLDVSSVEARR